MQPIFYSDYLLGNQIHPHNEFFANFPTVVNSLLKFEFKKDFEGNLMFPYKNEDTEHFLMMSQRDPALANLIVILKDYVKSPQNFVVKNKSEILDITEFVGYIRHEPLMDEDGVYFSDSFVRVSKKENIIAIVSIYKDLSMSYYRSRYLLTNLPPTFAQVMKIASLCSSYMGDPIRDKVKTKYLKRFTSSPYFLIKK